MLAALLFALGALLFRSGLAIGWMVLAASVLGGGLLICKAKRRVAWLALVPMFSYLYALNAAPHPSKGDLAQYIGRGVIVKGRVCNKVISLSTKRLKCLFAPAQMLFPDRRALSGQAELLVDGGRIDLNRGDTLKITGFVASPLRAHLAWQTDTAALLAKQSVYSTLTARRDDLQIVPGSTPDYLAIGQLDRSINTLRQRIVSTHTANLGDEAGSLLTSMVLGERAVAVDRSIIDAFRTVGLSHLIAASGFNLTVITAIAYWLARLLSGSKLVNALFALVSMVVFVLLAGLSASVLRAALMCALVLLARYLGRSLHNLAALAFALLLSLSIDPLSIADPGCQLSYAATAGIICGADSLADILSFGSTLKVIRASVAAASVVIAAQLAIIPIQLYYFWQIGLLFLPANLIVASIVAPVTVLGFVSSLIAALPLEHTLFRLIPWLLDALALYPLKLIIMVAKYLASFDAAVIVPGPPTIIAVATYYLALFSFLYSLKSKRGRTVCLVLFCAGGFLLFWRPESAQLSLGVFPRSIVLFGSQRKGLVIGEETNQVSRFLSYNGVCLENPSCRRRKIGDWQFDEYVLRSSKSSFEILLEEHKGRDSDQDAIGLNNQSRPNQEKQPLCRIAVLESRPGGRLSQQIAQLKEHGAADWIVAIEDDGQKVWRQKTIELSCRSSSDNTASQRQACPAIVFTLCPHRTLTVQALP